MKKIFFILIIVFVSSCNEKKTESKKENFRKINQKNKITGNKYFDFDELIHYHINFDETAIGVYENPKQSKKEKLKFGILLGEIPDSMKQTDFIDKLESVGYSKKIISKSKFNSINQIFIEKKHSEPIYFACVNIYRDILIFKKKSKNIGIAKICFRCGANRIYGTNSDTEEFGQSGDYEKLEEILNSK